MTSHEEAPTESENTAAGTPEAPPAGPLGWALLFARVAAWLVVPVYVAGVVALAILERRIGSWGEDPVEGLALFVGFGVFAEVGALLVAKRPGNPIGWILSGASLLVPVAAGETYAAYVMTTRGEPDWLAVVGVWANSWYWFMCIALALIFLPLLFPDGRLPSRRWLPVAVIAGIGALAVVVLGMLSDTLRGQNLDYTIENPIGIEGLAHVEELPFFAVLSVPLLVGCLGAVAAVVVRFRRSRGVERQQMKWFLYAAAPIVTFPVTDYLPGIVSDLLFGWLLLGLPTAIGIAVLRYRLYDIDVVIHRTLVYAALTVSLALVYLGSVVGLQRLLSPVGESNQLAVVASTLAVAALFNPPEEAHPDVHRSTLLPAQVRREKDARILLSYPARRDRPRSVERRLGLGGERDDTAGARLAVAARPDRRPEGERMRRLSADGATQGPGATRVVRLTPWAALGVSAAIAATAVALGLSGSGGTDLVIFLTIAVLGLVFGATGALVASRMPNNPIGWIFCALALLFQSSGLADAYVAYGGGTGASLPGRIWVAWVSQWFLNVASPALIILCFLLFPTGRLPSARWRPLLWVVACVAALYAASAALAPGGLADYPFENPVGVGSAGGLRTLADVSLLVLIAPLMLGSALSLFVRLRGSSGIERQQIKWFAYAATLLAAELVIVNALDTLFGRALNRELAELVPFVVFLVVLSGIPVAMGVAILRYRLYDIDIIINRTLVYGSLTASLVLVYLGGVVSLQYAFRTLTGGESQIAIVASTLAIAALFSPLRRRIQGFIDRRFYRRRYDAARTLEAFSAKLRDETDLDSLSGDLVGVVHETVQPEHASLWLRPVGRHR